MTEETCATSLDDHMHCVHHPGRCCHCGCPSKEACAKREVGDRVMVEALGTVTATHRDEDAYTYTVELDDCPGVYVNVRAGSVVGAPGW